MGKSFMSITPEYTPSDLQDKMKDMLDRGGDLKPWLRVAGKQVVSSVAKNQFRAGGTPKWATLTLDTLLRRGAEVGGTGGLPKPLLDTGILANSIIAGTDSEGDIKRPKLVKGKNLLELTGKKIVVGTNMKYAAAHQFGHDRIPARPFLRILPKDEEIMEKFLIEYITEGATKQ